MKKIFALMILTASASLLNANTNTYSGENSQGCAVQPGLYQQGQYGSNQGNIQNPGYGYSQSANAPQGDQELTTKIRDSLHSIFSKKYDNVNVTVNSGIVTLTGAVASQDDKNALEEKVRGIPGVQSVNNQITIQSEK